MTVRVKKQTPENQVEWNYKIPTEQGIPVVVVIRVSSAGQAEDDKAGIPAQYRKCEAIVDKNGLKVIKVFQIDGVSGATILRSPKMQEVLRLVQSGRIKGVVLAEESRLMRINDSEVKKLLKDNLVKLYLPDGTIDFANPSQKLFAGIKYEFAEYEREVIKDRTSKGKNAMRARGEWPTGWKTAAYGLKVIKEVKGRRRLVIDDTTIGYVIKIFQLFSEGMTTFGKLYEAVKDAPNMKYDTIRTILTNKIYTGWHEVKDVVFPNDTGNVYWEVGDFYKKGGFVLTAADDDIVGKMRYQKRMPIPEEDQRPPIWMLDNPPISEELFAHVQSVLEVKSKMRWNGRNTPDDPFVYRGFLRCGACKKTIITVSYNNKQKNFHAEYYACRGVHGDRRINREWKIKNNSCTTRRMRRKDVEDLLDKLVVERFGNTKMLSKVIADYETTTGKESIQHQTDHWNAAIARAERSIAKLTDLYTSPDEGEEGMSKKEYSERKEVFLKAKRDAEAERDKIKPTVDFIDANLWAKYAEEFQRWPKLNWQRKRRLLNAISPTFFVSGLRGKGYHETIIEVGETCDIRPSNMRAAKQVLEGDEELVVDSTQTRMAPNYNQPTISIPFNTF